MRQGLASDRHRQRNDFDILSRYNTYIQYKIRVNNYPEYHEYCIKKERPLDRTRDLVGNTQTSIYLTINVGARALL